MRALEALIVSICLWTYGGPVSVEQCRAAASYATLPASKRSANQGSIINGSYRNSYFQFSYQLPFGWVDRTSDIRDDTEKSKVLLAIFERPPAATGKTINSAVIIAAESVDIYPDLKNAADYFGPLTELTESKGFKVVNEPYDFPVDGKPIVRRDFTKERGTQQMLQASLVTIERGYVLSFTFVGGSQDEITELVGNLRFADPRKISRKVENKK